MYVSSVALRWHCRRRSRHGHMPQHPPNSASALSCRLWQCVRTVADITRHGQMPQHPSTTHLHCIFCLIQLRQQAFSCCFAAAISAFRISRGTASVNHTYLTISILGRPAVSCNHVAVTAQSVADDALCSFTTFKHTNLLQGV
jgi:hypothetical protein